jgi:divalent metal cation (Fe/Co/Zn/Cd) transporter
MGSLAESHDPRIAVDVIRAYHYGAAFNVEMEIILPAEMTVRESHDIALALQHRIEEFDNVERAFVHVSTCAISQPLKHA